MKRGLYFCFSPLPFFSLLKLSRSSPELVSGQHAGEVPRCMVLQVGLELGTRSTNHIQVDNSQWLEHHLSKEKAQSTSLLLCLLPVMQLTQSMHYSLTKNVAFVFFSNRALACSVVTRACCVCQLLETVHTHWSACLQFWVSLTMLPHETKCLFVMVQKNNNFFICTISLYFSDNQPQFHSRR